MTPAKDSQTIQLLDGRTLGYAEYGDPQGEPLLFFHGFPGSRLQALTLDSIASRLKVRLLSLDRPGFGLSTHDPNRRITNWSGDVLAFADQLDLPRFAIMGESGGGPFALVCAKDLPPERLTAVGIVAGAPEWDRGFRSQGYPWFSKLGYVGATYFASGTRVISRGLLKGAHSLLSTKFGQRKLESWLQGQMESRSAKGPSIAASKQHDPYLESKTTPLEAECEHDKPNQQQTESPAQAREELMQDLFGASFAQGTAGFVREIQLLTSKWGFQYEDIKYDPVQIWQGTKDENVPPATVRAMANRIPHCILRESDDTHYTIGRCYEEIITLIMSFRDGNIINT